MSKTVSFGGLTIDALLHDFINQEALAGSGIEADHFWSSLDKIIHIFGPRSRALVAKRNSLQKQIDAWHQERRGQAIDPASYKAFLQEIGYLLEEGDSFNVTTRNVDDEIAHIAGPQLVVPVTNARYALNAANARWGSLYDALYGTDAISQDGGATRAGGYNEARGAKVIAWVRAFLDEAVPLASGSHGDAVSYRVKDGKLVVALEGGGEIGLADEGQFAGYNGEPASPSNILLVNNGLHLDIVIDGAHRIGAGDKAQVADVVVESALTTIMDLEDSVACVDAEDKVGAYRNWLGLMKGDLKTSFTKAGKTVERALNADRS